MARVEAYKCEGCGRMLYGVARVALMVDAHPRVELDLCRACTVEAADAVLGVRFTGIGVLTRERPA